MQKEMNPAAGEAFDFRLGREPDRLDHPAAFAQHDGALALALDIDDLADAETPVGELLPAFGLDREGVGKLRAQLQEQLFAGDLRRQLAHRQVGQLVARIVPRPFWQTRDERLQEIADAVPLLSRDHEHLVEHAFLVQRLGEPQKLLVPDRVDLVQNQNRAPPGLLQPIEDAPGLVAQPRSGGIDDEND